MREFLEGSDGAPVAPLLQAPALRLVGGASEVPFEGVSGGVEVPFEGQAGC